MMRSGVLRRLFRALCLCSLVLVSAAAPLVSADEANGEPRPNTPIEHFIVLMQENHSFDNYFGTYPGADGVPRGTCMPLGRARSAMRERDSCVRPFRLGGREDGFVRAASIHSQRVERSVMGYYDERDLPFYWNVADDYVLFDRFFSSSAEGSVANHRLWVSGIFRRLEARGISWK